MLEATSRFLEYCLVDTNAAFFIVTVLLSSTPIHLSTVHFFAIDSVHQTLCGSPNDCTKHERVKKRIFAELVQISDIFHGNLQVHCNARNSPPADCHKPDESSPRLHKDQFNIVLPDM
jgi:hypothetical protein